MKDGTLKSKYDKTKEGRKVRKKGKEREKKGVKIKKKNKDESKIERNKTKEAK